ncbi:glycosyltransferase [uncultured Flavobacterium sp.]|uniref:glycosyltransferase n=1 Tax=uncultured Flavobacterium sp. TaxID=165435 RepID=UPI00292E77D7|nr:glycosyltransferase [uncultured Flavobacterium sp.]
MIPKKLHYCWFGDNPKSKVFEDCLVSWKLHCPDFEIVEWNETNSRKYSNAFYRNALRKKRYAFVADYIRTKVLYEQGGIYLDTDMLLLKPIDALLRCFFFTGEEVKNRVAFGLYGAIPNHRFLKKMLEFYNTNEFNVFSPPVITHVFSSIINKQSIVEGEVIFDVFYFYPLPYEKRMEDYTSFIQAETYAVHLWDHSWVKHTELDVLQLFKNLKEVAVDFIFYNYSFGYFKRYAKEFSRKIYHLLKSKIRY